MKSLSLLLFGSAEVLQRDKRRSFCWFGLFGSQPEMKTNQCSPDPLWSVIIRQNSEKLRYFICLLIHLLTADTWKHLEKLIFWSINDFFLKISSFQTNFSIREPAAECFFDFHHFIKVSSLVLFIFSERCFFCRPLEVYLLLLHSHLDCLTPVSQGEKRSPLSGSPACHLFLRPEKEKSLLSLFKAKREAGETFPWFRFYAMEVGWRFWGPKPNVIKNVSLKKS